MNHLILDWIDKIGQEIGSDVEVYQKMWPNAWVAVEKAFNHECSTAKMSDYRFAGVAPPRSKEAHHAVVFEPLKTEDNGWKVGPIELDVFFKHDQKFLDLGRPVAFGDTLTLVKQDWCETEPELTLYHCTTWGE